MYSIVSVSQIQLNYGDKTFSFTLFVDSTLTGDSVNYDCVIKSIVVTRLKDGKQIQTIIPDENYTSCGLPQDQIFIIEDINFDGFNDIRLLQFLPAAPNLPYYYWIYDPATQKYRRQRALEEITSPEFDSKTKLIYSFWRGSCCDHGQSTYRYINGKPTLIEESEVKEEGEKIITTLKKLVNGRMKLVKRTVEKVDKQ
ncbi:MAG: hypothetical protein J0L54_16855 [Chitinophagales bacterium]|nr:hypothetical protein [Chitinophagales bacterium]